MEIRNIPIGEVYPSPMNPRKTFDENYLCELADNIGQQGLLQPITVRPIESSGVAGAYTLANHDIKFEIVCGERRYRALCKLRDRDPKKWATVPAIVREMNDDEAFDAMITENLQRKDVDPMEEAYAFGQLIEKGNTAEDVALRFGKTLRFVQDRVKLNKLIPELSARIKDGTMAIAAGLIISKFGKDMQGKFLATYGNYEQIMKTHASSFADRSFMIICRSSWYESDNQEDENFKGSCGFACSECPHNTANANCLFWEMKVKPEDGKCTNRVKFEAKHLSFLLSFLESEGDNIVRKGEPLAYGKTVVIDTARCWTVETQRVHDETVSALAERGYEIVKPGDIFDSRVYYSEDDDRIPKMLENGEIYRCLDVLSFDSLPSPKFDYYYLKKKESGDNSPKGEIAPTEVVSLVGKYKANVERANSDLAKANANLAKSLLPMKRRGDLATDEQTAFDALVLQMLSNDFINHHYKLNLSTGMRPTIGQLRDIAISNNDDRALWYREFICEKIADAPYYVSMAARLAKDVLPLWNRQEYEEIGKKTIDALNKKIKATKSRLAELGYDIHGNKLES